MRVLRRLHFGIGLFCTAVLFAGCYGEESATETAPPVVQDMQIETPDNEEEVPMQ